MRSLALLILLCAAAFFLYPLAMQRTGGECAALARETAPGNLLRPALASPQASGSSNNPSGSLPGWASQGWPKPAGCAWLYWHRMLNPPG